MNKMKLTKGEGEGYRKDLILELRQLPQYENADILQDTSQRRGCKCASIR